MIYLLCTWLAAPWLWWRIARRKSRPVQRILIIQTAKIGDFVTTTAVFRALRDQLPTTEIVALLHPVNLPLAQGLDSIDGIILLPTHGFKGWAGKRWLYRQLRAGYDGVLILSPNLSTLLLPFWAAIPRRVAVLGDRRQGSARLAWPLLSHGEAHRPGQLFRDTALHALTGFGIDVTPALLALPNEAFCPASALHRQRDLLATCHRPLIGLGMGAGNRMKALQSSQLKQLAEQILARSTATLILIGTNEDQAVAAELIAALPVSRILDTTGRWSLADLPALLAGLDAFVGVDSGTTYLADALGVPVVDFMGPADASDQRPLGKRAVIFNSDEPCAPCSHSFDAPYRCRLGTRACINAAPLSAMAQRVIQLIAHN